MGHLGGFLIMVIQEQSSQGKSTKTAMEKHCQALWEMPLGIVWSDPWNIIPQTLVIDTEWRANKTYGLLLRYIDFGHYGDAGWRLEAVYRRH